MKINDLLIKKYMKEKQNIFIGSFQKAIDDEKLKTEQIGAKDYWSMVEEHLVDKIEEKGLDVKEAEAQAVEIMEKEVIALNDAWKKKEYAGTIADTLLKKHAGKISAQYNMKFENKQEIKKIHEQSALVDNELKPEELESIIKSKLDEYITEEDILLDSPSLDDTFTQLHTQLREFFENMVDDLIEDCKDDVSNLKNDELTEWEDDYLITKAKEMLHKVFLLKIDEWVSHVMDFKEKMAITPFE